jgi:hypothetical protein
MAERRLGLADNLARVFPDRRDPTRVVHSLVDMFRARMFAICCGYEDADDLDHLRSDPAFKLACGRLPDTGRDLCSQPTLSRLENSPRLRDVIRLTYTLVDAWMDIRTILQAFFQLTGGQREIAVGILCKKCVIARSRVRDDGFVPRHHSAMAIEPVPGLRTEARLRVLVNKRLVGFVGACGDDEIVGRLRVFAP